MSAFNFLQLVKNFPAFYGNRALKQFFPLYIFQARLIQSTYSQSISSRPILILYSYLRLGLWSGLLPLGFPTSMYLVTLISSSLILTTLVLSSEVHKSLSSPLWIFLHSPIIFPILGWIPFSAPYVLSKTLSLRSSLNVKESFSHHYIKRPHASVV